MNQHERKEQTKEAIENAAIECFHKRSFHAVTMEEIAEKSGYTKRTVYNYYPSKASLIACIFEKRLEILYEKSKEALTECNTLEEIVITYFKTLNDFTRKNYSFMSIFWSFGSDMKEGEDSREATDNIMKWNNKLINLVAGRIEEQGRRGIVAKYSPYTLVHYISALNKGLVMQYNKDASLELMKSVTREELDELGIEILRKSLK